MWLIVFFVSSTASTNFVISQASNHNSRPPLHLLNHEPGSVPTDTLNGVLKTTRGRSSPSGRSMAVPVTAELGIDPEQSFMRQLEKRQKTSQRQASLLRELMEYGLKGKQKVRKTETNEGQASRRLRSKEKRRRQR